MSLIFDILTQSEGSDRAYDCVCTQVAAAGALFRVRCYALLFHPKAATRPVRIVTLRE